MFEIVVRAFIIDSEGRILLEKRGKEPEKNKWMLPGGKVNEYEKAEDAIKKEVMEELHITFDPHFYSYSEGFYPERKTHTLALHFFGNYKGEIRVKEKQILEVKFFTREEIMKGNNFAWTHKSVIMSYLMSWNNR